MRKVATVVIFAPALVPASLPAFAVEYATESESSRGMFPDADRFADASVSLTKEQRKAIEKLGGVRQRRDKQLVRRAIKDGETIGWFLVDDVVGKHDYITYSVGLTPDGKVVAVDVLVYRETYGYQIEEREWRERFDGKTLADPFRLDEDIPNITGATLSCRNVTKGVKRLLAFHALMLADAS